MLLKTSVVLFIFLVLIMQFSCAPNYYQGQVSDHYDGSRFFNPGKPMDKGLWQLLKWRWTSTPQPWPAYHELPATDQPPQRVEGTRLRVSFVNHVTVLLQTQGLNILTDPVWSDRASPFTWAGPKRVHPPGIRFADLPPVDVVLISHNHYDHLDLATVERLWRRDHPRIITPLGNDTLIRSRIPDAAIEARDWGDQVQIGPNVAVHLEPMHHWSARSLFDRNRALWAAFVITTPGGSLYFVADSGYGDGDYFRDAGKKYASFRLALLPIGSYNPRWFMAYGHMNPEEAVRVFDLLGQPYTLPIHYGTFQLTDTGFAEPLKDLGVAMDKAAVPEGRIHPLQPGEHWWVP